MFSIAIAGIAIEYDEIFRLTIIHINNMVKVPFNLEVNTNKIVRISMCVFAMDLVKKYLKSIDVFIIHAMEKRLVNSLLHFL